MKIGRCEINGGPRWAVFDIDAGIVRPIEEEFIAWAPRLTADASATLTVSAPVGMSSVRVVAPIEPGSTILAAGATYAKHVAGLGLQMPKQPAAFLKTSATTIGPDDEIRYPEITDQLDYEGELVAVVGATSVDRKDPNRSILGYTIGNDVSARDQQFSGGVTGMDMFSAKALDQTGAVGPWIVTRDEFGDGHPDLELRLTVDGEERQHDRTSSMVWGAGELVAYVDARCRLHSGDILFTGTCAGVGHEDGRYLMPGQRVVVSIEGIGELTNVVGKKQRFDV